jgi:hypothetical protein
MPEGLVIVWQLGASSGSPGGSVKVFTDVRGGGLFGRMAVRCQLCVFPWRARKGVRRCQGGLVTVRKDR